MDSEELEAKLDELDFQPLTSPAAGRLLYHLALKPGIRDVLELGCAHGTSTGYMAAALQQKGRGEVTTIDRVNAQDRKPNIHALLRHVGLEAWARPIFAERSYTWEIMRLLERQTDGRVTVPRFDLCFVDGAHTWDADGFAFLLADRLLRPDRWMVFDDISWTLDESPSLRDSPRVQELPKEERITAQVRKVVDLLVRPQGYEVWLLGGYALAYKPDPGGAAAHRKDFEEIVTTEPETVRRLAFPRIRSLSHASPLSCQAS